MTGREFLVYKGIIPSINQDIRFTGYVDDGFIFSMSELLEEYCNVVDINFCDHG